MQLPSMKASDDEEDEQKHVVAPLHTAEGEEADDDEEEEQDKADTSKNSQDGDQGHDVVEPIQIPMVESIESDFVMPIEHNEVDSAAKQSVVDVKTVVVAEVVEAVVAETEDMMVVDKEESVSIADKSNENKQVYGAHVSSNEMQGDAPTKMAATSARVPRKVRTTSYRTCMANVSSHCQRSLELGLSLSLRCGMSSFIQQFASRCCMRLVPQVFAMRHLVVSSKVTCAVGWLDFVLDWQQCFTIQMILRWL